MPDVKVTREEFSAYWVNRKRRRARLAAGVSYSAEAQAVFDAWAAVNPVNPTPASVGQKLFTEDFIGALIDAGIWTKLDILGDGNVQGIDAAAINWKNPALYVLTHFNTVTFPAPFKSGLLGNGTSSFVYPFDYIPSEKVGINFLQNDHSFFANGIGADPGNGPLVGTYPSLTHYIYPSYSDNIAYAVNGGGPISVANTNKQAFVAIDRTASNAWRLIVDGAVARSGAQASAVPQYRPTWLAGRDGGAMEHSTLGLEIFGLGGSLTDGQYVAFKTARDAYLTAKREADLVVYTGTSYFNDAVHKLALPVAADANLSTAPHKATMIVRGGGKTTTTQLNEWNTIFKSWYNAAHRKNILVVCPGDGDRKAGPGATTIAGMLANVQTMVSDAKADGWMVVVTTVPAWSHLDTTYTAGTRAELEEFVAGILALDDVDAFCDLTQVPQLWDQNAYLNTTYYRPYPADPVPHPNGVGDALWGMHLAAAIESVR